MRRRLWGALGSLALLGSVTAVARAVTSTTPASAAAGNVTRAVIGSTTGDPLGQGAYLKFDSISATRSGETLTINLHSIGQDWTMTVQPKIGGTLHSGLEEIFTASTPAGDGSRAGLNLTGTVNGQTRQCPPDKGSGSYRLKALNGSSGPVSVAMDFTYGCDDIAGNPVMEGWIAVDMPPGTIDPVTAGDLVAIQPLRVLDTRVTGPALGQGEARPVPVTGIGPVPTVDHAMAVVLNVTAAGSTADSHLSVYPTGQPKPDVSNLNFGPNQVVPNLVTVRVGSDGMVNVSNFAGNTHVIIDIVGYFAPEADAVGSRFRPQDPQRILDTREQHTTFHPGEVRDIGVTADPAVTAVVLNVTVANAQSFGYVTVYPADQPAPLASNLNYKPGDVVPNLVVAKTYGGKVNITTDGTTDLVVDIVGTFTSDRSTGAGRFVPMDPVRKFDTRLPGQCPKLGPGAVCNLGVVGQIGRYPLEASGVVFNATAANTTADSYLTFWPSLSLRPLASNLNWRAGETRPNLVMMSTDADGFVTVLNAFGATDVIVDVAGWFTA